jgi:hypothetical protein
MCLPTPSKPNSRGRTHERRERAIHQDHLPDPYRGVDDLLARCCFFDLLGADMTIEHLIVGATGIGYLIVGVLQWSKGELSNGMIWTGYAFAQVGLWLNLK